MTEEYARILGEFHDPILRDALSIDEDYQVLFTGSALDELLVLMTLPKSLGKGSTTRVSLSGDLDFAPEASAKRAIKVLRTMITRRDKLREQGYQKYENGFELFPQGEGASFLYEIPTESEDGLRKIIRDFGPGLW